MTPTAACRVLPRVTVTPSHCRTVRLSHRPTVPLSHRATVPPSHCPTVPLSHCRTVPPSHRQYNLAVRKPVVLITGAGGEIGHGLIAKLRDDRRRAIVTLDVNRLDDRIA